MSNIKYDYVVYIGRFSPFHKGHLATIDNALKYGKKVIILIGSSFQPRTIKNPWTWEERKKMIDSVYFHRMIPNGDNGNLRIIIKPLADYTYNDQQWFASVQQIVSNITLDNKNIAITGYNKDSSSYYLKNFPQWEYIDMNNIDGLNATDIRTSYFSSGLIPAPNEYIPEEVFEYLKKFKETEEYKSLVNEYKFIQDYKKQFSSLKYPPIFVTTDAIVIQSGHVLLIKRKSYPGKGLFALPGGFIKNDEKIIDAMIRELKEETRIKVPIPVLLGHIKNEKVFDAVDRSLRGRTITHAFLIELESGPLPLIKSASDSEKTVWLPLNEVLNKPEMFFEDHYQILNYFINNLKFRDLL